MSLDKYLSIKDGILEDLNKATKWVHLLTPDYTETDYDQLTNLLDSIKNRAVSLQNMKVGGH